MIAAGENGMAITAHGTLTGDRGTVEGDVTSRGLVSPGQGLGILTIDGNYTQELVVSWEPAGTLAIELGGVAAGQFDQLVVTGDVSLDGLLDVQLVPGFQLGLNQRFDILPVGGSLEGTFYGLAEGDPVGTFDGVDLFITYGGPAAPGVALYTVPEPTSFVLMFTALALFAGCVRRYRFSRRDP